MSLFGGGTQWHVALVQRWSFSGLETQKTWQCFEGMREDGESFKGCKMFVPEGLGKAEGSILLTPINQ